MQIEVQRIDPLTDPRWPEFLERHPDASIFHTREWMLALQRTYGYEPIVYTTSKPNKELADGIPFCRVESWLTGRRLVSVPFSDHCQPLVNNPEAMEQLLNVVEADCEAQGIRYVELRPWRADTLPAAVAEKSCCSERFYFHRVDISCGLEDVFARFHKDSVRKKLRKAEQDDVVYREGVSEPLVSDFYHMLIMTRRRHQVPPQPKVWFTNMAECLGDLMKLRIAYYQGNPVVALITARYKQVYFTKYSCSNAKYMELSGTQMKALTWQAIQDAIQLGAGTFDMGRSDPANAGLVDFKDRWGSMRTEMTYYKLFGHESDKSHGTSTKEKAAKWLFARMPGCALSAVGRLLYKHMG